MAIALLALSVLGCGSAPEGDAPVPLPPAQRTYEVGEYPGTYLGVCQRMDACLCPGTAMPDECAKRAQEAILSMRMVMADRGVQMPEPTEEQLAGIANGECEPLCNEIRRTFGFE